MQTTTAQVEHHQPQLTSMCVNTSWPSLPTLAKYKFIEELIIQDLRSVENIPDLSQFPRMESIYITNVANISDFDFITSCKSPVDVHFSDCQGLLKLPNLRRCTKLQTITIYYCKRIKDISELPHCQSLTRVDLEFCDELSDVSCLGKCPRLQELKLEYCKNLRNVSDLAGCENVASIDIHACGDLPYVDDDPETVEYFRKLVQK